MAEYIEREKLISRLENAKEILLSDISISSLLAVVVNDIYLYCIKEQPAADVVEVVRCKDCIHYSSNKSKSQLHRSGYCLLNEDVTDDRREETDFCSYGVRKELDNGKKTL